jgi:peptidoglycan hydrolase CwlO-like protein
LEEKDVKIAKLSNLVKDAQAECDSLTKEVEDMSLSMASMGENMRQTEAAGLERSNQLKLKIGELEDELEETRDLLKLQISEQAKQQDEFVMLIDHKESEAKDLQRQLRDSEAEVEELARNVEQLLAKLKESQADGQKLASQVCVFVCSSFGAIAFSKCFAIRSSSILPRSCSWRVKSRVSALRWRLAVTSRRTWQR